jgi:hypothetical protein
MTEKVRITWHVEDGYVNNGPHSLSFDKEEWDSMTEDERHEAVTEQAMQKVSIAWKVKP